MVTVEFPQSEPAEQMLHPAMRFAILISLFVIFALLIWNAGRAGLSSLLSSYAATTNQIAAAEAAVKFSQSDPEAICCGQASKTKHSRSCDWQEQVIRLCCRL